MGFLVVGAQTPWTLPAAAGGALLLVAVASIAVALLKRRRRGRFALYGSRVVAFHLEREGDVRFAQWLHPKEEKNPKVIRQEDVDALRGFVREGDTVIDIGAHTGDTTVPLGLAAGASGCVFALEPNPHAWKVLDENAKLNREKTNIVALNFAATETDGTFTFHYSDGGYCNGGFLSRLSDQRHGHRQALEVQGRNLEAFLRRERPERLERLTYVKIDTEGYDAFVISSIMGLIKERRPVIVCEVYSRLDEEERHHLFDVLDEAGYECRRYQGAGPVDGEPLKRADMTARRTFDVLAIPRQGTG
ncbi:MAG: FkbM family methyltransferase [Planctomycetota bacterium]|jgi:FkbM family methyltransferase